MTRTWGNNTFKQNNILNHNNTRITCLSSCCVPKVSQINGNAGEATNTDDLKKQDRRQNVRLSNIERRLAAITLKKKKSTRKAKKTRLPSQKGFPFLGIPNNSSMDLAPPITHKDPNVLNTVAQLSPFRIPRGVANLLEKAQPSQKFTSRCLTSVTVPASQECLVFISPCVCSDTNARSLVSFTGTRANLAGQLLSAASTSTGVTLATAQSNTPYTASVLAGSDFTWRLVSAGIRLRNTTAAVNRQGVVKFITDYEGVISPYGSGVNIDSLISLIDANHRTVRKNTANEPDTEITLSGQLYSANVSWYKADTSDFLSESSFYSCGHGPVCNLGSSGYRAGGTMVVLPLVGTAQSYDFEIIEHWEVHGSGIETLHTPSASHSLAAEAVSNLVKHAHHSHSQTPSLSLAGVAKGISFAEHHKTAIKDAGSVAMALAML